MELFVGISAAIALTVAAIAEALIQLGFRKQKIKTALWKIGAVIMTFITDGDILHDRDDEIPMPTEYASWASAELWRKSCIRPGERRM